MSEQSDKTDASAETITFDFKGLDKVDDPEIKAAITALLQSNSAMNSTITEMKGRDDLRVKAEEKLRLETYNLDRAKILEELKLISPKTAEKHKDSHKDELVIRLDQAKTDNPKFQSFSTGADNAPLEKKVLIGYDRVKGENVYK